MEKPTSPGPNPLLFLLGMALGTVIATVVWMSRPITPVRHRPAREPTIVSGPASGWDVVRRDTGALLCTDPWIYADTREIECD